MPRMLEDHIAWNRRKSYILLLVVPVILLLMIYVTGRFFVPRASPFVILSAGIAISLVYVLLSYFKSDEMILKVVDAEEADPEQYGTLYDLVEGLTLASGMPMPDLYVQESPDINAFATGRKPEDGVICVTTGAIDKLDDQELEGVLAHELAHIQNHDILFMTLVVALIGAISIMSEMFLHGVYFGDDDAPAWVLGAGLLLAILAPIVARLVQLGISRKREYLADSSGAKMTRYPDGLADALSKIQEENQGMDVNRSVRALYISSPVKQASLKQKAFHLTSTHPPLEERINRLRSM